MLWSLPAMASSLALCPGPCGCHPLLSVPVGLLSATALVPRGVFSSASPSSAPGTSPALPLGRAHWPSSE